MHRTLSLLAALACWHAAPRVADACSQPACWPGAFVPADAAPAPAHAPANLPGIVWQPVIDNLTDPPVPANVVLSTAAAPGTPLPFTVMPLDGDAYVLIPDAPFEAGNTYLVRDDNTCGDTPGPTATFTATSAAPFPTSLGTLVATYTRGPLEVGTSAGSCSVEVEARIVDLELELIPDALPWRDALVYQTFVDGEPWRASASINARPAPGASWVGRGKDRLYRVCGTPPTGTGEGLAEGPHQVTLVATIAGSDLVVQSQTLTVDLSCDGGNVPPECVEDRAACGDNEGVGCSAGGVPALGVLLVLGGLLRVRRRRA